MLKLYYFHGAALLGREEAALALVPEDRQARFRRCKNKDTALGILAGGLLLRHALGAEAAANLARTREGKPYLPGGPWFSLSHTGSFALLVTAEAGPVGADAEPLGRTMAEARMGRLLTARELAARKADPGKAFGWFWTRKEAVMKYSGLGLGLDPRSLDVLEGTILQNQELLHLVTLCLEGHFCSLCARTDREPAVLSPTAAELLADIIA